MLRHLVWVLAWCCISSMALAQQVKVIVAVPPAGMETGPARDVRDGFRLALDEAQGRLGGVDTVVVPFEATGNEAVMGTALLALAKAEKAQFVVGALDGLTATGGLKALNDAGVMVLKAGRGSSELAGRRCLAGVFVVGLQDKQVLETLAHFVDESTFKRIVIVTSASMSEATNAMRRSIKSDILKVTELDDASADYSESVANLLQVKPQTLLLNAPVAVSASFLKALRTTEAGRNITVLATAATDETALGAFDDPVGLLAAGTWSYGLDTPLNTAFVEAFERQYGYVPSTLAVDGYDAGRIIDAALKRTGGATKDMRLVGEAIKSLQVESPRGTFIFANNNFPVQDFYVKRIERLPDGVYVTQPVRKVFAQFGDDYAAECPLK